jgi:hypothetical protein
MAIGPRNREWLWLQGCLTLLEPSKLTPGFEDSSLEFLLWANSTGYVAAQPQKIQASAFLITFSKLSKPPFQAFSVQLSTTPVIHFPSRLPEQNEELITRSAGAFGAACPFSNLLSTQDETRDNADQNTHLPQAWQSLQGPSQKAMSITSSLKIALRYGLGSTALLVCIGINFCPSCLNAATCMNEALSVIVQL